MEEEDINVTRVQLSAFSVSRLPQKCEHMRAFFFMVYAQQMGGAI